MKRTSLRKKGKSETSKVQQKLWELCKQITRSTHGNTCYTCGRPGLEGSNWHTGHMWAKGSLHALLKYDIRILRPQCYNCNIHWGGMGAIFYERMTRENGVKYMQELEKDRIRDKTEYVNALDHYKKLLVEYQSFTTL